MKTTSSLYTRLSAAEIDEREQLGAVEFARQEAEKTRREADLAMLRAEAKDNPAFAALLRHLGVPNGTN